MDEAQQDFLKEVLNIGLGRAGKALGAMTGSRIDLTVPSLSVCALGELDEHLGVFGDDDVFTVALSFSGILSGDVLLVMSSFSARVLTFRLCGDEMDAAKLESEVEEVVTEVGNIIANHFVGSWSNLFADQFKFGVPAYEVNTLAEVMNRYKKRPHVSKNEPRAIFAQAQMDVPDFTIAVSLITLFQQDSLERLIGSTAERTSA